MAQRAQGPSGLSPLSWALRDGDTWRGPSSPVTEEARLQAFSNRGAEGPVWAGEWVKRKRMSTRQVVHSVPRGICVCAPVLGEIEAKEEALVPSGPGLVIHTVSWQSEHRHRGVTGVCPPYTDTLPCRAGHRRAPGTGTQLLPSPPTPHPGSTCRPPGFPPLGATQASGRCWALHLGAFLI